jgi:hypothetical protein
MSRSLGSLTLDLIVEFGGFIEGWDKAERETKKRSKQLRKEFKELGDDIVKWGSRAVLATTAATAALIAHTVSASRELGNLSQVANASIEEFQRYAAGSKQVGVEQEKLADIFQGTNKSIGEFLRTGAGPMKDFFEKIAPKIGVTAAEFRNLSGPQALQLYFNSLERANLSQGEMAFYLEKLANSSSKLIPLLKNGGQGFKLFGDEAQKAGGILSTKTLNAADKISAVFLIAENSAKGFKNQLAEGLLPTVRDLTGLFVGLSENQLVASATADVLAESMKATAAVLVGAVAAFDLTGKSVAALMASLTSKSGMEASLSSLSESFNQYATLLNGIWDAGKGKEGEMNQRVEALADMFKKLREDAGSIVGGSEVNAALQQDVDKRLEILRQASMSELQILEQKRNQEFAFLLETYDAKTAQFEFQRQKGIELTAEQLEQERVLMEEYRSLDLASQERYEKAKAALQQREADSRRAILVTALGTISTLMNSENKKMFEVGKIAAIANATIAMFEGVGQALRLPWPLNMVIAPLVGLAGMANIQSIKKTQFGGGSAGVSNTQAINARATPVIPPGSASQANTLDAQGGAQRQVNITISGPVDRQYLRDALLPVLQEEVNENDVTFISANSAQARELRRA